MGYWEQIAEENLRLREERPRRSRWRRVVVLLVALPLSLLLWALMLAPLWRWLL